MNKNLLKLAKMILKLAQVTTDKGILVSNDELVVGSEVFIEDENGELLPASDGDYETEEKIFVVAEGKVVEIKEKEVKPEETEPEVQAEEEVVTEEPVEDEKDVRIAELEANIAELEASISEKDETIAQLQEQIKTYEEKEAEQFEEQKPAFKNITETKTVSIAESARNVYNQ